MMAKATIRFLFGSLSWVSDFIINIEGNHHGEAKDQ
jgi:hypothetical protein